MEKDLARYRSNWCYGYFEEKDKLHYIESSSIVGSSALSLREIILKNKNDFAP